MTRSNLWLNGVSPRDLDPRIIIDGVTESPPKEKSVVASMGYTHGSRLTKIFRQELSVSVTIGINETDPPERDAVYQSIRRWGRFAGYIIISKRANQRLYVESMDIKTSGNGWAEKATLTFTAYAKPFWENVGARSATIGTAATSGSATLSAPGNADECKVDAEITAIGGTLNALTVTVGSTTMTFAALGLAANSKLTIGHTDTGLLTIKSGETSMMAKRTGADELIAIPGSNTVSFTSDVTCTASFSTRGRWL